MKKYIFMRLLRSLVSIFLVTTLIYTIVYTLVPRRNIFKNDPNYTKMTKTPDSKADYENTIYERMGYVDYYNSKELQAKAESIDKSVTQDGTASNKKIYEDYIKKIGNGWKLFQFESGKFYAVRQVPIFERVFEFYTRVIEIDHPWRIQDKTNPDLPRYIKLENDPSIGWSVVGSGTEHKYLLYVNNVFPYIHQNFITLNLGRSYPTYKDAEVTDVITQGQGRTLLTEVTFPESGTKKAAVDIYSRTYQSPEKVDSKTKRDFGDDPYSNVKPSYKDPSMIASSAIIGLFAVIFSYVFGILWGILMARFKDKHFDTGSKFFLNFLMSVPSVATAYIISLSGSKAGLPGLFTVYGAQDARSYILPALVLGVLSLPSMALWMRRYQIDQQNSDYVRFARAKGLSEREISRKHILKNAMVPVVSGIPGSIVGVIVGATLTESIFAYPGMGKMMIDSISASNNAMIVGLNFLFTTLGILALLAGDLLMVALDPRIKLSAKQGGK